MRNYIYDSTDTSPDLSDLHGYGIFANRDFKKFEIVEVAPIKIIDTKHWGITRFVRNKLERLFNDDLGRFVKDYSINTSFQDDPDQNEYLVFMFGNAPLYNHAEAANVGFVFYREPLRLEAVALRDIQAQEELFINYGSGYWESRKIKPILN